MEVVITGAGIGSLTPGLRLYKLGIPCRIYEAALELKALGVGIMTRKRCRPPEHLEVFATS